MPSDLEHLSPTGKFNSRLGIMLFLLYLIIYGIFVVLCAFAPHVMSKPAMSGMNVATVYGFTLIILAFVLAMIYMLLCRTRPGNSDGGAS